MHEHCGCYKNGPFFISLPEKGNFENGKYTAIVSHMKSINSWIINEFADYAMNAWIKQPLDLLIFGSAFVSKPGMDFIRGLYGGPVKAVQ